MGGKGSSGGGTNWDEVAYNNAYAAAQSGQPLATAMANQPGYEAATQYAYDQFGATQVSHTPHSAPHSTPHSAPHSGSSYDDMLAQQQAAYEAQLAEQRRIAGEGERDTLYAAYLDAAGAAADFVNAEISSEISNAKLLGIDYEMDDEIKSQRVSDYFATVWGEGDQQRLEALMGEWGNPSGFTEWTVVRGDASTYGGEEGAEETVSTGRGQRPKTLVEEEEETLGGASTVLGV